MCVCVWMYLYECNFITCVSFYISSDCVCFMDYDI